MDWLTTHATRLPFPDIAHELRLKSLSAKLTTYIQGSLTGSNVVIPRTQVKHRTVKLSE
ncbi:MAG: hypothetical protein ACHP8A_08575 [Terriglobales bacterium]|jgi:hypothetical protein|nr:hypothetical protein [Terriglobales bacterium]